LGTKKRESRYKKERKTEKRNGLTRTHNDDRRRIEAMLASGGQLVLASMSQSGEKQSTKKTTLESNKG